MDTQNLWKRLISVAYVQCIDDKIELNRRPKSGIASPPARGARLWEFPAEPEWGGRPLREPAAKRSYGYRIEHQQVCYTGHGHA